jgi:hypothetical protein
MWVSYSIRSTARRDVEANLNAHERMVSDAAERAPV